MMLLLHQGAPEQSFVVAYNFPGETQAVQSEASAANSASAADFTRIFIRKPGGICAYNFHIGADKSCKLPYP